jgi:hypothetical protein
LRARSKMSWVRKWSTARIPVEQHALSCIPRFFEPPPPGRPQNRGKRVIRESRKALFKPRGDYLGASISTGIKPVAEASWFVRRSGLKRQGGGKQPHARRRAYPMMIASA